MPLTGAQAKLLHEALISAFDFQGLRQLMAYDLDEQLENVVGNGPLDTVVYELIEWLDHHGRVDDFIRAAVQARPHNQQMVAVAAILSAPASVIAIGGGGQPYDGPRRARLRAALLEQFPKRVDLAILLDDSLSQDLDAVASTANQTEAAFELTQWFGVDLRHRLEPFLAEAIKRRPNATDLIALHTELFKT